MAGTVGNTTFRSFQNLYSPEEKARIQHIADHFRAKKAELDAENKHRKVKKNVALEAFISLEASLIGDNAIDIANLGKLEQRAMLATLLSYYEGELAACNPVTFAFETPEKKATTQEKLELTLYFLYLQYKLNKTTDVAASVIADNEKALMLCTTRLQQLQDSCLGKGYRELNAEIAVSEKACGFLCLSIGYWLANRIDELMDGKTDTIIKWMSESNYGRLYWVWGGGVLRTVLSLLADEFFNKQHAEQVINHSAVINAAGCISWGLYWARFALNAALLLKHTIGVQITDGKLDFSEWRTTSAWDRFKTQVSERKFILLNDSIWGTANFVCYWWLYGSGMLGYAGNLATIGLLVLDLTLATWRFIEDWTKHNKEKAIFKTDIKDLTKNIKVLKEEIKNEQANNNADRVRELETQLQKLEASLPRQIAEIEMMRDKCELEWKYKCFGLINDWGYSLALLASFAVACCFFFPPAAVALIPVTAVMVGLVGSVMCFSLSILSAVVSGSLTIAKSIEMSKLSKAERAEKLIEFNSSTDEDRKKVLYLEIKALDNKAQFEQRLAGYNAFKTALSTITQALVPLIIFSTLTFLPIGVGIPVLAAAIALIAVTYMIVNRMKPEPNALPQFEEQEFSAFEEKERNAAIATSSASSNGNNRNSFLAPAPVVRGGEEEIFIDNEAEVLLGTN